MGLAHDKIDLEKTGLCVYDPINQLNNVKIWMDEEGFVWIETNGDLSIRTFNTHNDNIVYLNPYD